MRALTVYQPWCSLIMIGAKPFEFRTWDFSAKPGLAASVIGQRVVMHASARKVDLSEVRDLINRIEAVKNGDDNTTGLIVEPARELLRQVWENGGQMPIATHFYGGAAIYGLTPVSEDTARAAETSSWRNEHRVGVPLAIAGSIWGQRCGRCGAQDGEGCLLDECDRHGCARPA
jgi:hypothetical protein